MNIGVTGALGCLCHALLREGHTFGALVRSNNNLSFLQRTASGGDGAAFRDRLRRCDLSYSLAATSSSTLPPWLTDPSKFFSVNVGGLENVWETKTVEKVVYASSFFALGPTDGHVADETQLLIQ
ncbi:NAD(P)-binding domain containing protein [Parasponia andersonii]|uniref:NAD(P)-binding domain containing protein n=1 Tax=Parasponia andersonii TaxID=3476 RepID=A0A2P5AHU5_PARAD|nr:NAD(P)-binding domain containing protein [Parasponia andersonii]